MNNLFKCFIGLLLFLNIIPSAHAVKIPEDNFLGQETNVDQKSGYHILPIGELRRIEIPDNSGYQILPIDDFSKAESFDDFSKEGKVKKLYKPKNSGYNLAVYEYWCPVNGSKSIGLCDDTDGYQPLVQADPIAFNLQSSDKLGNTYNALLTYRNYSSTSRATGGQTSNVPEPMSISLLAMGLLGGAIKKKTREVI